MSSAIIWLEMSGYDISKTLLSDSMSVIYPGTNIIFGAGMNVAP